MPKKNKEVEDEYYYSYGSPDRCDYDLVGKKFLSIVSNIGTDDLILVLRYPNFEFETDSDREPWDWRHGA